MVPTRDKPTHRSTTSVKSSSSKKQQPTTYRADRVKSSIPKPLGSKTQKPSTSAKYLEELQKKEVERAIILQEEEKI